MKNLSSLFLALVLASSVSFGQTKEEKKKLKEEEREQGFLEMKKLIDSGTYEFEGRWATSQRGARINLMTNPTFLKMTDQEADAFFPFFGQRFTGSGAYGTDSGIEFNTTVSDYKVSYNEKKKQVIVNFKAKGKNDTYKVRMVIFSKGNSSITITSDHRSVMNYDGVVKELVKKETGD